MTAGNRIIIIVLLGLILSISYCGAQPEKNAIGIVIDDKGPVAKVSVGWQGQSERVLTDIQSHFRLPLAGKSNRIIASKTGYRIASAVILDKPITLRLERLPTKDNPDYE